MQQYQALHFQALHLSGEQTQIPLILLKYNPLKRSQNNLLLLLALNK